MAQTIFASFVDPADGQRAAGALFDRGVTSEHLTLLIHESWLRQHPGAADDIESMDRSAKTGVSTTTAADATVGAERGAGVGVLLGLLGGLAALTIPGFGLVIGGGALATVMGAAIGTVAAGAVAGGLVGYLRDQGVPATEADRYNTHLGRGGALLSVQIHDTDSPGASVVNEILNKYGAADIHAYDGVASPQI